MELTAFCVDITPTGAVGLAGYAGASRISERATARLEVNGWVTPGLNAPVAVLAIDALFSSAEFERGLQDRVAAAGRDLDALVVVASHTHSGPTLDPTKPILGSLDRNHFDDVIECVGDALVHALAAPLVDGCTMRRGESCCTRNVDRRRPLSWLSRTLARRSVAMAPNPTSTVRHTVDVISVGRPQRAPEMVLWSWPCHATSEPDGTAISPDFPGHVRQAIRDHFGDPDIVVAYLPGFAGDLRTGPTRRPSRPRELLLYGTGPIFAPNDANFVDELVHELAAAVIDGIETGAEVPSNGPISVTHTEIRLDQLMTGLPELSAERAVVPVVRVALGGFELLGIGAEVCDPYHELLAGVVPAGTFMTGYCGHVFGYLPSDRQVAEGGYEAKRFIELFSLEGSFKQKIEHELVAAARTCWADC